AEKDTLEMLRRIERTQLPTRVALAARREAERLRTVSPASVDASEIRNHLDLLLSLPWSTFSKHPEIDVESVRLELDARHLGLDEVKRRILEFLSVAKLRDNLRGPIPCIVGPPDVGKRSLAEAVAAGLGRPLVRLELGGRGEAELLRARRTRSGAQPGKTSEG